MLARMRPSEKICNLMITFKQILSGEIRVWSRNMDKICDTMFLFHVWKIFAKYSPLFQRDQFAKSG